MYFLGFCVGPASEGQKFRIVKIDPSTATGACAAEQEAFSKMQDFPSPRPICATCLAQKREECFHYHRLFDRTPYATEADAVDASKEFMEYTPQLFLLTMPDGSRRILDLDKPFAPCD